MATSANVLLANLPESSPLVAQLARAAIHDSTKAEILKRVMTDWPSGLLLADQPQGESLSASTVAYLADRPLQILWTT